ncbi:MAG: GNAT family N-acetyltransferase [Sporolactobacillus sp.]
MVFRLHTLDPNAFHQIYQLMALSFPPEEIREERSARRLLDHPNYRILTAVDDAGALCGFFAIWDFKDFQFIEHFAVNPAMRGQGLGSQMLRLLMQEAKPNLLLEVETPENELARRRIQFYQRLGFILSSFGYEQPKLQENSSKRFIRLQLMTWPAPWAIEKLSAAKEKLFDCVY